MGAQIVANLNRTYDDQRNSGSGVWGAAYNSAVINLDPAYGASQGYSDEIDAVNNGCCGWTVFKAGARGVAGVAATGALAIGGAGFLSELISPAAESGSSIASDVAAAERHLGSIPEAPEYWPNRAMLDSIRGANAVGRPLSAAERAFLDHELLEARLTSGGVSREAAHQAVLKVYPPGSHYSPEVTKEFSDHFSDAYFNYWGISR
jgi:hypothetical protein